MNSQIWKISLPKAGLDIWIPRYPGRSVSGDRRYEVAGPGLVCADALLDLGDAIHWRESSLYDHWFHDEPLVSAAWMQKKKQREVHTGLGGHSWAVSWLLFSRLVTSGSSGRCSFSSFSLGKPGKLYCIYILYQRLVHRMCPWVRKLNLSQRQLPMAPRKPRCRNRRTTTWVPEVPHHGTMVKHLLRKKTKTRLLQASCHRIQRCRSATFWWFQLYIYIIVVICSTCLYVHVCFQP